MLDLCTETCLSLQVAGANHVTVRGGGMVKCVGCLRPWHVWIFDLDVGTITASTPGDAYISLNRCPAHRGCSVSAGGYGHCWQHQALRGLVILCL